jgi:hypothetical protein
MAPYFTRQDDSGAVDLSCEALDGGYNLTPGAHAT